MEAKEDIDKIVYEVLEDFILEAVNLFHAKLTENKQIATGELLRSFQSDVLKNAGKIEAEIKFAYYGKFRDMRSVGYKSTPPSGAIEAWIMAVGPSNFQLPQAPTVSKAVKKLVWAILRNVKKNKSITNKKGAWKNTSDYMKIVGKYRSIIARKAGKLVANYVAVTIGDDKTDL